MRCHSVSGAAVRCEVWPNERVHAEIGLAEASLFDRLRLRVDERSHVLGLRGSQSLCPASSATLRNISLVVIEVDGSSARLTARSPFNASPISARSAPC
jgi:hypothetical protein